MAGGDPGFPLRVVIVQACPRRSRQPAVWHQALSHVTAVHVTNIGKLCPRCQRGRFFGPSVSGLQPLLPSLDAALCVLPQLSGSEPSDVGPRLSGVSWFSRPGPLFAQRSVPWLLAYAQAFAFQLPACTSPTSKRPGFSVLTSGMDQIRAMLSLRCWPSVCRPGTPNP